MHTIYEDLYKNEEYYWSYIPSYTCLKVLEFMPSVKKLKLLDIGCGEGRDSVFFARNGYDVTAFDLAISGVEKTQRLAEKLGVKVNVFQADLNEYRLTEKFDILFSNGVLHYVKPEVRKEMFDNYKAFTEDNGIHMLSVFVDKPFIAPPPEYEETAQRWISGELLGYYHDWKFEFEVEEIFDCNSSGVAHQHAMTRMLARKMKGIVNRE